MSDPRRTDKPRMSARERRTKLFARILAGLLALLMVGGSAYYLIYMLVVSASAADANGAFGITGTLADDVNIRVGLKYGDGVPTSFETMAPAGYTVGVQPMTDDVYEFIPFWQLATSTVVVAPATNLAKTADGYVMTDQLYSVAVGGYRIEFLTEFSVSEAAVLAQQIDMLNATMVPEGFSAFPVYTEGRLRIGIGSFATYADAQTLYPYFSNTLSYLASYIVEPSATGVTVLDPSTNRVLFVYDASDGTALGLTAYQTSEKINYTKTTQGNVYDGIFAYKRSGNGVSVTNVLTLDQYVQGVLPYEISASWPIETQSAFAIAARSYAASNLGTHQSAYGFDLCNGAHCQAYLGAARVNDQVIEATKRTHGLIAARNGKAAPTFYSSSSGGYTVGVDQVWGNSWYSYLSGATTPWERYSVHPGGFWTTEISPYELYTYLVETKGKTDLAGGSYIVSIEPLEYVSNTTYIKSLKITADNGKSITLTNTDGVRMGLYPHVKSANFVVGKGSVAYTYDTVEFLGERVIDNAVQKKAAAPLSSVSTAPSTDGFISSTDVVNVLTATVPQSTPLMGTTVLTSTGHAVITSATVLVLTADNAGAFSTGNLKPSVSVPNVNTNTSTGVIAYPQTIRDYTVHTEYKVATASSPQNFIFVGKGTGHGAGLSQYGAYDLGLLGYDYEQIFNSYFSDLTIVYYKELDAFKNR